MTQEEKILLIKELCGRLPYEVKIYHTVYGYVGELISTYYSYGSFVTINEHRIYTDLKVEDIKPYFRPLSSMTKEEREELKSLCKEDLSEFAEFIQNGHGLSQDGLYMFDKQRQLEWLNVHHFDYRGLIPKGLALEAPEDMYKTE